MEEKLKDSCTSYESKLLVEEKKHRDAAVRDALACSIVQKQQHEKGIYHSTLLI